MPKKDPAMRLQGVVRGKLVQTGSKRSRNKAEGTLSTV
jgi:hypothetical protein